MKTAEELYLRYSYEEDEYNSCLFFEGFEKAISERDKEWTQKIQDALDKETNWDFQKKLKKLLEDKL